MTTTFHSENSDVEIFYDYSPQRKQCGALPYGIQVMKNGMFVGAPIWVATEEEAKLKIEEMKGESK